MSFVKYERLTRKKHTSKGIKRKRYLNKVGIHPEGKMVLSKPVSKKYFVTAGFIEFYYDPDDNKIGILPLAEETEHTLKIHGKTTKMIFTKKFFNKFKIKPEKSWYEYSIDGKMLVIQL